MKLSIFIKKCFKNGKLLTGFTLIELIVAITVIAILFGIILLGITNYINKGKDSNISGNLAVLIPAGEVYYNAENISNGDGYTGFCDPNQNSVIKNIIPQMPQNPAGDCLGSLTPGICCKVSYDGNSWAACTREFTDSSMAYCVDSRSVKEEIPNGSCINTIVSCP